MLKVIFASLFVVMVIVRKIQNNKAHEENEDEVDDETYEAQEKNNNASVASNTPKQSVLNVAHLLIVMTLIVIISIGIIIKVRSYTKLTNSEYPLMVGEISMENMPVVEILNNQETNRSQAGHYPLKTKGTITYSINVHTNGDDFSIRPCTSYY